VARAFRPGIKYDYVPTLLGGQGIGKSTTIRVMGGEWFCDSLEVFEGKEAAELIQGKLIIELGEMRALTRSDENAAKHFISKTDDQYRATYGRTVQEYPRRCVFFGTTNMPEFLRDPTGNRRFWPIRCGVARPTKNVFVDLEKERDQIWAEAVELWQDWCETLYLPPDLEAQANMQQVLHREEDPRRTLVMEWLQRPIPRDWLNRDLSERLIYWGGEFGTARVDPDTLVSRQMVSRMEIWCECLRKDPANFSRRDANDITGIMETIPGWFCNQVAARNGNYGVEKVYRRV
jgi:predicted P-loop ATPase